MISNCNLNQERLSVIAECMETYGMEDRDPGNEWVWNLISRKAVVYSCGAICRKGEVIEHNHHQIELEICQRLSQEVAELMSGEFIKMGDEGNHGFYPFYVVANDGEPVPEYITEEIISVAFGGTIYPGAEIRIEPMDINPQCCSSMLEDLKRSRLDHIFLWFLIILNLESNLGLLALESLRSDYSHQIYMVRQVRTWLKLVSWFRCQSELHGCVFASIYIDTQTEVQTKGFDFYNGGCVLPRLFIGLTPNGSLVGVFSCVVYT